MKILITGAGGYIGSMLSDQLVRQGYKVIAIDTMKYAKNSLNHLFFYDNFKFVNADVTSESVLKKHVKNVDFIIPLAALVGAPICEKNKKQATAVNFTQIKIILKFINKNQKIIYLNSNSGYGVGKKNKYCTEESSLNPISHYGITKVQSEQYIVKNFKNFVCFRLATVFGYSYRMRTDLIVNYYIKEAINNKNLEIFEPHFRRNFIHVKDVTKAIQFAIENFNKVKGQIYNLGLSNANITKLELAKKIKKVIPKLKIKIIRGKKDPDQRDYFVSNKKIEKRGFKAKFSLERGINEVYQSLTLYNDYKNNY
jgi:nucleoside-diphosphate-sugar epimerase